MVPSGRMETGRSVHWQQGGLTARVTTRAETKVGQSDPTGPGGRAVA